MPDAFGSYLPSSLRVYLRRWPLLVVLPYLLTLLLCVPLEAFGYLRPGITWLAVFRDEIYSGAGLFMALAAWCLVLSIRKVPRAIEALRGAAATEEDRRRVDERYGAYADLLFHPLRWLFVAVPMLGAVLLVAGQYLGSPRPWREQAYHGHLAALLAFFAVRWLLAALIWSFGIGMAAWYMFVTTRWLARLPREVELRPSLEHPDGCGGLRPFGVLCVMNSVPFLVAALFLAAIGFGFRTPPPEEPATVRGVVQHTPSGNAVVTLTLAQSFLKAQARDLEYTPYDSVRVAARFFLIVIALPLALFALLTPLLAVHQRLAAARERRIAAFLPLYETATAALHGPQPLTAETAKAAKETLEALDRISPAKVPSPLWPIDVRIAASIATPQLIAIVVAVAKWLETASL